MQKAGPASKPFFLWFKPHTGTLSFRFVPSPSWPSPWAPQHCPDPPVSRAQEWDLPTEIDSTPAESPETSTGVFRFSLLPSPNWPNLFSPPHFTAPPETKAQVWFHPAEMAIAFGFAGLTSPGFPPA